MSTIPVLEAVTPEELEALNAEVHLANPEQIVGKLYMNVAGQNVFAPASMVSGNKGYIYNYALAFPFPVPEDSDLVEVTD